jgi:DNA helicase-2/ATP-dependent DNA helicase PcrA
VPTIAKYPSDVHELAGLVAWIRARMADGVALAEIAVLARMNAQLEPIEEALTRAGIAYQVRGVRFYERPEIRGALAWLRRANLADTGPQLGAAIRRGWAEAVGWEPDPGGISDRGLEARERQAALDTLVEIVDSVIAADGTADARTVIDRLDARAAHERENAGEGVNLLTYHRAKGLEWDAVYLPSLEEGILPVRQAKDDDAAVAEERRLLYVGITRARVHLALSWAERREVRGRPARRETSRFLLDLRPKAGTTVRVFPGPPPQPRPKPSGATGDPVFDALRDWRTAEARAAALPPYVVAHDATLKAIAEDRPRTLAALRRVKGMGPARIDKYGDAILATVAEALDR